jgi:PQQ-like domain
MVGSTIVGSRRSRLVVAAPVAVALMTMLAACQTPLGQGGLDNANTSSNATENTLNAANVGGVVAKFDTDLTGYGSVTNLGDPVFSSDGNIIVTTDDEVVAVKTDGTVAWHVAIPDPHPEVDGPHIISVYGDVNTVDVLVDSKVQGAGPDDFGGSIVKLANASGAQTASQNTFRPAAPLGYLTDGLVVTGEVIDHAEYGAGRTVTIDTPGSGRRIIRNAVGAVQKPAVIGVQLAVAVGSSIYQWTTPCPVGTVCDESTAAVTTVPDATRPVIVGTTVYTTSSDRKLYAIDPTGAVLWTGNAGNIPAAASASVASGRVFVGNTTGIFYGFDLAGCGATTCSYSYVNSFVDQIWTAPTLANGLAYVMVNGALKVARTDCTLVENCSPKKSITLNGPILGSSRQVLVKDGRFYVLTNDGHLRAWGL